MINTIERMVSHTIGLEWMKEQMKKKREAIGPKIESAGYAILILGSVVASYVEFRSLEKDLSRDRSRIQAIEYKR